MKPTEQEIQILQRTMRGRTNVVVDRNVRRDGHADPTILDAQLQPFVSQGLLTADQLDGGRWRYALTARGRSAVLGSEALTDEDIKADARRAYLMFRGSGEVGTVPSWEHLSDSMQSAFVSVFRTATIDAERRLRISQRLAGKRDDEPRPPAESTD